MAALGEVLRLGSPAEAGRKLLQLCAERVGVTEGSIYLLDPGDGTYSPFVRLGAEFGPPELDVAQPPAGEIGSLSALIGGDEEGIAVYARRGNCCPGLIALPEVSRQGLGMAVEDDLSDWTVLLGSIHEDDRLGSLMGAAEAIRKLGGGRDEGRRLVFLEEAGSVLSSVTAGRVLVHELERGRGGARLRCVFAAGYETSIEMSTFDLSVEDHPVYGKAAAGVCTEVPDLRTSGGPGPPSVGSAAPTLSCVVLPIRDGQVAGVLTIASRREFEHTPLELQVLQSLADSLGFALSSLADDPGVDEAEVVANELTALELARVGRHEAKGYIDNCIKASSLLWGKCRGQGIDVEPELDAIAGSLKKAREALDRSWRMEAMWEESPRRAAVDTVWKEACTAFEAHLRNERIETRFIGPRTEVEVSSGRLRTAFLNLIINSIEAFRRGRRSGRAIELKVDPFSPRDRDIRLTYRDNGPGINRGLLRSPDPDGDISQLLFEKGTTSKKSGPGFGLWLVRKSLKQEGGSIDLLKSHDGARFAIRLPNPDNRP